MKVFDSSNMKVTGKTSEENDLLDAFHNPPEKFEHGAFHSQNTSNVFRPH